MATVKGLPGLRRKIQQKYNLVGNLCKNCGEKFFPPRYLCPNCRRAGIIEEFKFSGNGEVFSYTVVYAPREGFEFQVPYVIGIVKLDEGPLVLSQIVDAGEEDVDVGARVKMVFRKVAEDGRDGVIRYGYKFKLCG